MIAVWKYLRGYLRIKVWGFAPERFLNLCSNKAILLWDITREENVYYMNISLKNFYRLKGLTRKTGTRVVICKRYGLPFFIPTLQRRKVFVAGLLITIGFWLWSSFHIWEIRISGNYQITQDVLEHFLKQEQVTIGMRKNNLQIEELEKQLRRTFPEITWTSAKLSGTKLLIDIKEYDAPIIKETEKKEGGTDLVSQFEGTIVSMIVRSGVPQVKIGDTVAKGTLLVDGKVPVYNEDASIRKYQYVQADADIVIEHTTSFEEELPEAYVQKEYTGRMKRRYFVRFGEKEWKMPENRPFLLYDSVIHTRQLLVLEKLRIPLFWGCYTHREYLNVEYDYTPEEAKALLQEKINTFLVTLQEKGVQIIEKDVKIDTSGGQWVVKGELLIREAAGVSLDTTIPDMGE